MSLLDVIRSTTHTAEVVLLSDGPFRELLEQMNVPVHILSAGNAGETRRDSGVGTLLASSPSFFRMRTKLALLASGFDVIYANSQKAFLVSALAKQRHQFLIWHLRDILDADHFSSVMRRVAVFAGNNAADLIIANSMATLDALSHSGGRREKAVVIYNGINQTAFDAVDDSSIAALRSKLGLAGKFVVGAFGRLSPWKGQLMLVEALSGLPEVHAVIVGDALFGEKAYAESLQARVRALGLEERVHFLGFRRDIPLLMRTVDVVVHSAISPEPFGRVIVEGMLARRPVIATRAGGALEILTDGETGILVPPGDIEALRQVIARLKDDPAMRVFLGERGRQHAIKQFSVERMVALIDDVLTRIRLKAAH